MSTENQSTDSMEGSSPSPTTDDDGNIVCSMFSPLSIQVAQPLDGTKPYEAGNYFEQAFQFMTDAFAALDQQTGLSCASGSIVFITYEHWGKRNNKSVCVASVENIMAVQSDGDGFSLTYEELVSALNGLMSVITEFGPVPLRSNWGGNDPAEDDFWAYNEGLMSLTIRPKNQAPGENKPSHYAGANVCALAWGLKSIWGKMARTARIARQKAEGGNAGGRDTIRKIQAEFGLVGRDTQRILKRPDIMALRTSLGNDGRTATGGFQPQVIAAVRALVENGEESADLGPRADIQLTVASPSAAPEKVQTVAAAGSTLTADEETAIAVLVARGMTRSEAIVTLLG